MTDPATGEECELVQEVEVTEVQGWAPSVTLEVKEKVSTGEENEEDYYSQRSKLYRWAAGDDENTGEWKERGLGEFKLLKHKTSGKIRALLRQEKTGKVVCNHYVVETGQYCSLRPQAGSDKVWVWMASDFAEGELVTEQFALKFGNPDLAKTFETKFNEAKDLNKEAFKAELESGKEA